MEISKKYSGIIVLLLIVVAGFVFVQVAKAQTECTSFTYSDWSVCSVDAKQTRTVLSSSPESCTGGGPVISQSCTYNNPSCISFSYSDWGECKKVYGGGENEGYQNRDVTSKYPADCQGGSTNLDSAIPQVTQLCKYTPPCSSDTWACDDWNTCSSYGSQTRTCKKTFDCPTVTTPSPAISQSCTAPTAPYVCYPNCDARVCVNDSCNQSGYMKATVGDKISIVHRDLKLSKKITVGSTAIDSWNFKDDILEFFLPDNIKTGGVFVNVYHSDGNLIAGGTLTVYSKSTLPPPSSCTADTWTCGAWGSCSLSGVQNRSCTKTFDCPNVQTAPPTTDQYCEAPSRPAQQVPQNSSDIISNQDVIIKSTVKLLCPVDGQKASQGSGTIINSNGTILTNKHVIAGTLGCLVGFITHFNDEPYFGERHIADIARVAPNHDIAILKIRNPQNKVLPNIDITNGSSNARLGVKITTYGFPAKFGTKVTYTSGDFSGTDGSYIKTTAILEYGNSGGGAYLKDGTFIGIPSAVVKGELNALGYILSINTINAWLGNSSIVSGDASNNQYSRVSVLEDIDLNKLDALKLFIPDTDAKGNLVAPPTNQGAQTQKESTVIESTDTSQKIDPEQSDSVSLKKELAEEKENDSGIKISEQRRSVVANAVQEVVKVAERSGGVGQEIKIVAQTQFQDHEKLETSVQKIQSRSGFVRFFIGSDYGEIKNSRKLLEQNKEHIHELDQLRIQVVNQGDQLQIVEQIQFIKQANQQIEISLNEAQKRFSLLGWMFRLFAK